MSDCALCLQDDQRYSAQATHRQPSSSSLAQVASTSWRAISRKELSFRNFLREELGENNDDEEMQDMINQADGDGEISHNEEEGQLP